MNIRPLTMLTAPVVGAGIYAAKKVGAKSDKPVGATGSLMHVMTNDKIDNKVSCLADLTKEGLKDTAKLGGLSLMTGAAASLATGNSNKITGALHNLKHNVGEKLSQISISKVPSSMKYDNIVFEGEKAKPMVQNLKEIIKNSNIYKTLNQLPTPAKAGLAAGAAALAILTPIFAIVSSSKSGYIEAQHETK